MRAAASSRFYCESANASAIVAGLNATARPNIELALRRQRRDLPSGSSIGFSFRVVLGFFMVFLLVVVCFARGILGRFPALQKCAGSASFFGSHPFISLSSSGVI